MLKPRLHHPMATTPRQRGYILLEVLISVVIFCIGLLGLASLYANTIKSNSDGKFRMDACQLAISLVSQMQSDNRSDLAALGTLYQGGLGTNGSRYLAWRSNVIAQLPGVSATQNVPTVAFYSIIDGVDPPQTSKRIVTINVSWQLPGEDVHRYVLHTIIK